ncbi:MAG: hypothetical protein ACM3OO_06835 [Planctomycetaceae bacterium]
MRRVVVSIGMLAILGVMVAPALGATPQNAKGSVGLSGPSQSVWFRAYETTPARGRLSYTNWENPVVKAGTGAWEPNDAFDVVEMYQGAGPFTHSMKVTSMTPTFPMTVLFSGTGSYDPDPSWTETFTGRVRHDVFNIRMKPDDHGAAYGWTWMRVHGTIDANGDVEGTWTDSLGREDDFTIDAAAHEVLHYAVPVMNVAVDGTTATFDYVIPAGILVVDPYPISVKVTDGGSPGAGHDTISFNGSAYPVVSGDLTVSS